MEGVCLRHHRQLAIYCQHLSMIYLRLSLKSPTLVLNSALIQS